MVSGQLKKSFLSIGEIDDTVLPYTLELRLSFSQEHLRYFVLSNTHARVLYFGEYTLHHIADEEQLAQRIEKIYAQDEVLQLPFARVLVGLNTAYTLLPAEFAFMKKEDQLLQWCKASHTNIAFTNQPAVTDVFNKHFKKPQLVHLGSSLLNILPQYLHDQPDKLFVNVQSQQSDVVLFRTDQSLVMMNRFTYKTDTDFIYFLLLCCDELKVDREKTTLVLLGEVSKPSKIYDICYRYFTTISFIEAPADISFSTAFDNFEQHRHFTLYNLNTCE